MRPLRRNLAVINIDRGRGPLGRPFKDTPVRETDAAADKLISV